LAVCGKPSRELRVRTSHFEVKQTSEPLKSYSYRLNTVLGNSFNGRHQFGSLPNSAELIEMPRSPDLAEDTSDNHRQSAGKVILKLLDSSELKQIFNRTPHNSPSIVAGGHEDRPKRLKKAIWS
jgi:hypothetical protein